MYPFKLCEIPNENFRTGKIMFQLQLINATEILFATIIIVQNCLKAGAAVGQKPKAQINRCPLHCKIRLRSGCHLVSMIFKGAK